LLFKRTEDVLPDLRPQLLSRERHGSKAEVLLYVKGKKNAIGH